MNTIEYNHQVMDYMLNGKSFLEHLQKHEKIQPNSFIPAFLTQPLTHDRLCIKNAADLTGNHIAIYLCGHCGGYDGGSIGVKITVEHDKVIWDDIGIYEDFDEGVQQPFKKVRRYIFSSGVYQRFLDEVKVYQVTD